MSVETLSRVTLTETDFDVFAVPGLEARMDVLKATLRPKLGAIGALLTPVLSTAVATPMYPHVAKHARRKTNPPNDSWVAFSQDPRGYKKWPTFMVGVWQTHVYAQFGVIYESPQKAVLGRAVERLAVSDLQSRLPEDVRVYSDYTAAGAERLADMPDDRLRELARRVQNVKQADLLFGVEWPRASCLRMTADEFETVLCETCQRLASLYDLAMGWEGSLQ